MINRINKDLILLLKVTIFIEIVALVSYHGNSSNYTIEELQHFVFSNALIITVIFIVIKTVLLQTFLKKEKLFEIVTIKRNDNCGYESLHSKMKIKKYLKENLTTDSIIKIINNTIALCFAAGYILIIKTYIFDFTHNYIKNVETMQYFLIIPLLYFMPLIGNDISKSTYFLNEKGKNLFFGINYIMLNLILIILNKHLDITFIGIPFATFLLLRFILLFMEERHFNKYPYI